MRFNKEMKLTSVEPVGRSQLISGVIPVPDAAAASRSKQPERQDTVTDGDAPAEYLTWRVDEHDRAEDAANTFGYHLMLHCRDEALATVPTDASDATREAVENAVDLALHNVMDLLEGFWSLPSGASHSIEYVLSVRIQGGAGETVETVDLSPCKLDLPIGYWKWARERDFR